MTTSLTTSSISSNSYNPTQHKIRYNATMSNHNTDDNGCLLSLVKKIFCQDTSVPEQHTMQIGEPYGFQHVKHVGFDQETGAFTGDQLPSGQGAAENIATATAVDPTTGMSIGEPYGFTHVTHVSYSEASGFVGLPDEWRRALEAQGAMPAMRTSV